MKKAQMLQFLFYAILALVIFIPTVMWASQLFKLSDKSMKSFNQLSGLIDNIKDGEINSMALYLDSDSFIVGFSKGAGEVEALCRPGTLRGLNLQGSIDIPPKCDKDKSCICLCRGIEIVDVNIKCKTEPICNNFKKIDFFKERIPGKITERTEIKRLEGLWRNGFIIMDSDRDILYNTYCLSGGRLYFKLNKPISIYVQRYQDFVNVCFDRNCITNQMIDDLNKEDAIKEFKRFKTAFLGCKQNQVGYCGTFSLNLPERYYIYFDTEWDNELYLINTDNTDSDYIEDNFDNVAVKDEKDNEVVFDATIYKDDEEKTEHENKIIPSSLEMKKEDGKIIFKIT